MSLTILGAHGGDVWVETDGEITCLDQRDLAKMQRAVRSFGRAEVHALRREFDESDVTALTQALNGPQLDDCAWCEQPGLIDIEGRMVCPGHANGYGFAEQESEGER